MIQFQFLDPILIAYEWLSNEDTYKHLCFTPKLTTDSDRNRVYKEFYESDWFHRVCEKLDSEGNTAKVMIFKGSSDKTALSKTGCLL